MSWTLYRTNGFLVLVLNDHVENLSILGEVWVADSQY